MQIHRYHTRLSFRGRRRRRSGCMPSVILLGILVGVGALSWNWLQARLAQPLSMPLSGSSMYDRLAAALAASRLRRAGAPAAAVQHKSEQACAGITKYAACRCDMRVPSSPWRSA